MTPTAKTYSLLKCILRESVYFCIFSLLRRKNCLLLCLFCGRQHINAQYQLKMYIRFVYAYAYSVGSVLGGRWSCIGRYSVGKGSLMLVLNFCAVHLSSTLFFIVLQEHARTVRFIRYPLYWSESVRFVSLITTLTKESEKSLFQCLSTFVCAILRLHFPFSRYFWILFHVPPARSRRSGIVC